jgi:oligopeptide transport system substrate-binding protein
MRKVVSSFLIFVFCAIFCHGCKNNNQTNLTTYRNFYDQDVSTFNYILTNTLSDYTHIANFVDGLVENDKYGDIVPSIAKSWKDEIIDNKQIWTFYLRDDAYWTTYKGHKYGLVTAHDFVNTIKYVLNYNIESNNYNLPATLLENALNYYNATLIKNYNYNEVVRKISELSTDDTNGELDTYIKIKDAFDYCNINICSDDFSSVGIKAVNDFELQFTLSRPTSYFLSALTYCSFLPSNEQFIKDVGFNNFGTSKKYLLYSGAYILKDYYHSSKIEYVRNENYWDKDKVYIDKIIFNKIMNYPSASYTRLAYETGNSDAFYVDISDTKGWTKYVTGENGEGSINSPVGNNTYVINETTDFTTYYLLFNQNRTTNNYSTLSKDEIALANLALSNDNFRRALVHGLNSDIYSMSLINEMHSSIVPSTFVYNEDIDYHTYFLEEYAKQNNITYQTALEREESNILILDFNKSAYYLDLALSELSVSKDKLPIKLEFSYFTSLDYVNYDLLRIKEWNNILNGCAIDSQTCTYNKVLITYNDTLSTYNDFNYAIRNGEYSISFLGLHPNFIDPTAYLEAFGSTGEIYPFLNHNHGKEIDRLLADIQQYYKAEDLETRFKLCAELEYKIIFEYAIVLPLLIKDSKDKILVSNLEPYQRMKSSYGLSSFKFKLRKVKTKDYTQTDILQLKEEYEKGRSRQ